MTNERQVALNAAAGAAAKRLKDAHLDEYNGYYAEEAQARGQEWSPRLTPEQRAEQDFDRLLAEHPHLADKVAAAMDDGTNQGLSKGPVT